MLSKFFIDRPVFATVISIIIVLVGLIALPNLPVEKNPNITPPTVNVETVYPGANAEVVARTVTTPLEEQINGVEDMLYMSSKSSDDGSCSITVTFKVGTDIDMASVLVQNRVAQAEPLLPEEVKREGVTVRKQSSDLSLVVSIISPDKRYDAVYISNYITTRIKDSLARVQGVGNIAVFGSKDFAMRVWIDPEKLEARSLAVTDVINAIREQNVQVASGKIGLQPNDKEQQFEYTIKTLGRLMTAQEFGDIIVRAEEDSKITYIKDVARVELGSSTYASSATLNGQPTVAIGIFQLPGANSLAVAKGIRLEMARLARDFPVGLDFSVPYDPTRFISESIKEVMVTLIIAILLVVLTVYVFLEDLRATLIPAITIPVSLIGTFAVMHVLGMSINTFTLFGLVLVIGIVVDDAIVVVENTIRIMEEEKVSAKTAITKGMTQITGPVIATTLVLLAVFIPTALVGGISGKLYSQFALTISTATVFSTINALTLSPAMCGIFLRPPSRSHGWFFTWFDKMIKNSTSNYISIVRTIIRRSFVVVILYAVMLACTYFGIKTIPTGFIPTEDEGFVIVNLKLPDGAGLHRTQEAMEQVNHILATTEGVGDYVSISGFSLIDSMMMSNGACCFVRLDPWEQRKNPSLHSSQICQQIQMRLFGIKEGFGLALLPPPIRGLGLANGFEMQLQDRGGAGLNELEAKGNELVFNGNNNPMITRMNSTFRANIPQVFLDIDRTKAKTMGLELGSVFGTLQATLGSYYINDFNMLGKTYKVIVQADESYRNRIADISKLKVRNNNGQMIPLDTFVKVNDSVGPQSIMRYNMYPSTTITGMCNNGASSGEAMEQIELICKRVLPANMGYQWSGISYQQIEAGNKAPIIFLLSSVFVFLFLAAQYESWSIPVAIVLSIPIAIFGAVAFLWFRVMENNIYTQIGLVLLIGQASKTAILLVEFAKQLHEEGKSVYDAAIEAARLRFRPILMTALSFVFGVIPLVIATGAGAASRQSLGTTVFGGMLIATVLGVFAIPVFYVIVQNIADRFKPVKRTDIIASVKVETVEQVEQMN